jgi:hypothetical protein
VYSENVLFSPCEIVVSIAYDDVVVLKFKSPSVVVVVSVSWKMSIGLLKLKCDSFGSSVEMTFDSFCFVLAVDVSMIEFSVLL